MGLRRIKTLLSTVTSRSLAKPILGVIRAVSKSSTFLGAVLVAAAVGFLYLQGAYTESQTDQIFIEMIEKALSASGASQ